MGLFTLPTGRETKTMRLIDRDLDILSPRIQTVQSLHCFFVPVQIQHSLAFVAHRTMCFSICERRGQRSRKKERSPHSKNNPTAQHEPRQSRKGPGPESQDTFVFQDTRRACETVSVLLSRFDGLHSARPPRISLLIFLPLKTHQGGWKQGELTGS